jgi:cyanate permease
MGSGSCQETSVTNPNQVTETHRMTDSELCVRLAVVCVLLGIGFLFEPGHNWRWALAVGFQVGAAFLLGSTLGRRWQAQGK